MAASPTTDDESELSELSDNDEQQQQQQHTLPATRSLRSSAAAKMEEKTEDRENEIPSKEEDLETISQQQPQPQQDGDGDRFGAPASMVQEAGTSSAIPAEQQGVDMEMATKQQPEEDVKPRILMPSMQRTAPLPPFVPPSLLRKQPRQSQPNTGTGTIAVVEPVASTSAAAANGSGTGSKSSISNSATLDDPSKPAIKRNRVRTVGDNDDECPICASVPAAQRKATTRGTDRWLQCDACSRWFHWESCVKRTAPPKSTVDGFDEWYCLDCLKEAVDLPDVQREIKVKDNARKSSRKKAEV